MSQEPLGTARSSGLPPVTNPVVPVVEREVTHVVETAAPVLPVRNRVQWGPIIAGLVSALTIFLLLSVLGIAIGASVLDPNNAGDNAGLWATIWGIVTTVLAFFVGGWIAAKSAAVGGGFSGLMNGMLVGAAGLVLVIWLTASGLGNLFGAVSSNVGDILNFAQQVAVEEGITPDEAQQGAEQAADQAEQAVDQVDPQVAFEAVRNGALGTFFGMLLLVVSASVGGLAGQNSRWDLWDEQHA